ncbi:hypothetical protein Scep_019382 [Stephania cephalantha]|uniref:Uncharacterized protein n=1 Tax=Stephania cephalantha TaxID=152367 RepID=A0AAP0NM36_9MAGN
MLIVELFYELVYARNLGARGGAPSNGGRAAWHCEPWTRGQQRQRRDERLRQRQPAARRRDKSAAAARDDPRPREVARVERATAREAPKWQQRAKPYARDGWIAVRLPKSGAGEPARPVSGSSGGGAARGDGELRCAAAIAAPARGELVWSAVTLSLPIDPRRDNNGGQGIATSTKLDDAMDSNGF